MIWVKSSFSEIGLTLGCLPSKSLSANKSVALRKSRIVKYSLPKSSLMRKLMPDDLLEFGHGVDVGDPTQITLQACASTLSHQLGMW